MRRTVVLIVLVWLLLGMAANLRSDAPKTGIEGWRGIEGDWIDTSSKITAEGGYSILLKVGSQPQDLQIVGNVRYAGSEAQVAAGVVFRFNADNRTGYIACVRDVEKGNDPE